MTTTSALLAVVVVGVVTYAMRAVAIVALADRTIPTSVERALRNVGPAVLAALAINLAAGGDGGPSLELAEAGALIVAGLVAWRRHNLLLALSAGMLVLWLLTALT